MKTKILILAGILISLPLTAQVTNEDLKKQLEDVLNRFEALSHRLDQVQKSVDDLMWYRKLEDVAILDKVYMYGPPLANESNPTAQGYGNPVKFWSYVIIPKGLDESRKYPLIVFPHGGVHSDFSTYYTHIVRELIAQGYVVIAAEYRGSPGYGAGRRFPAGG